LEVKDNVDKGYIKDVWINSIKAKVQVDIERALAEGGLTI
jgi:hypothetical protein